MTVQLPLKLQLTESATFANFYSGDNSQLITALREQQGGCLYYWGATGVGKTHLMHAVCHESMNRGLKPVYLSLNDPALRPPVLEGLEQYDRVCLDNIEAIAGDEQWEVSLFHLYNRLQENNHSLLVSAGLPLASLGIKLADLQSRLRWGLVFQLRPLGDYDKQKALQHWAGVRGLQMSDDVAQYLLKHCPRDMKSLFDIFQQLDQASMATQRKLTIPFVREHI